ncbi:hypothetical protein [Pseudonocardia abyssalis]|uniref:Plasmid replication, integration and excision activator n=1 Tax=Pseudonocardia abyssalis TaxID=2792008 RepID=A0ABS6UXE8_9PSEU|nr:hypothetical protein [Pseudonocardia abyssalis]MBW0114935.1 hypothetical protein [Pseudonocardia abyssalis]MBW0136930.1 hypothetical protein [Pseudonocardia abyssalis]
MRQIPVDMNRVNLIGTGKAAARAEYVELSDGQRRRSGNQAKDETTGMPVWVVDVLVDDPEADRAEVVGVRVSSHEEPVTEKWKPVRFRNLVAVPYADRSTGRVALSMRADGIEGSRPAENKPAAA